VTERDERRRGRFYHDRNYELTIASAFLGALSLSLSLSLSPFLSLSLLRVMAIGTASNPDDADCVDKYTRNDTHKFMPRVD
jgi:hypothetical protein